MNRVVSARNSTGSRPAPRRLVAARSRSEGALAEYSALRTELLQLSQQMTNLFALHVGAAGSILSVSLASADKRYVALVLRVVSFLFCARYFWLTQAILNIGRYTRDKLSGQVPGGLGW